MKLIQEAGATRPRPPREAVPPEVGVGTAFGTFGELLQGVLPEEDGDFLVTLPVARWTMATFRPGSASGDLEVSPAGKTKALRLARMIVDSAPRTGSWNGGGALGAVSGGLLTVNSVIPEGKGLASSSADLVATARAVGRALGVPMPPPTVERLLSRIEPTDGVLYPAIVAFHHRSVRLRAVLGSLPAMVVVGVDEGGAVDTVDFNRIPKPFTPADRRAYAGLLDRLARAVRRQDLAEVGRVATRSALMNQRLRYKALLEPMRQICREVGGLGVAVGHSGTTLGVLVDATDPSCTRRVTAAAQACAELTGRAGGGPGGGGKVAVYRTLSFGSTGCRTPGRWGARSTG